MRPMLPLLAVLASALALAPAAGASTVRLTSGVVYGHGAVGAPTAGSAPLLLDLYQPAHRTAAKRPVVVLIHGGGFAKQSRTDPGIVRTARALAARGDVVASIDYRLLGTSPVPSARVAPLLAALPAAPISAAVAAAVDDTLTATDYLAAHAKALNIDLGRLGMIGSSAGAITADQIAYTLDDHGIAGPKLRFVASLWGGILVPAPAALGPLAADQLEHGEPPLFAVHGDADTTVPVALDDQLVARARAEHVPTEYRRIPGGTHGYDGSRFFTYRIGGTAQTPFDRLLRFAQAHLR